MFRQSKRTNISFLISIRNFSKIKYHNIESLQSIHSLQPKPKPVQELEPTPIETEKATETIETTTEPEVETPEQTMEDIEEETTPISLSEQLIIDSRKAENLHYEPQDEEKFNYTPNARLPGPSPFVNQMYRRKPKYYSIGTIDLPLSSKYPLGGFPEIWIYNSNSTRKCIQKLSADLFNQEIRIDILYRCCKFEYNRKQGISWNILPNRSEVAGSSRKVQAQKGTGRARRSDNKAPHILGGGFAHAKRPKDRTTKLSWKLRKLGYKVALSARYREGDLYIWEDFVLPKLEPVYNPFFNQHAQNKHQEIPSLIPVHELDSNMNTVLYSDVYRSRQMFKKWGWLKGSIYNNVNDKNEFKTIIEAKKSGNIIDLFEAMPIAKYQWEFLKEEDELMDATKCSVLFVYVDYINPEFKEAIERTHGADIISWDEIEKGLGTHKLLKYKKVVLSATALQFITDLLSVEGEVRRWNFHAAFNRIRQDEQLEDAFPQQTVE